MDVEHLVRLMLDDLSLVATFSPNERLPKEEQIRCSIYAAIRPLYEIVCAERGYGSIDDGIRAEADLWAVTKNSPEVWIEFKRCWAVRGWNNKPLEQLACWRADLTKLLRLPTCSDRYFILVGVFDTDPLLANHVLRVAIDEFCPSQLIYDTSKLFSWRQDDGISHIAAWVWCWPNGYHIVA